MTDVDGIRTVGETESGSMVPPADDECLVTAHCSSPGRTVFTERGNTDAWIASDLTVDCARQSAQYD